MQQSSNMKDRMGIGGTLEIGATILAKDVDKINIGGLEDLTYSYFLGDWRGYKNVELVHVTGCRHNAFVNTGLQNNLDLWAGLGGSAVSNMGVTDDSDAVTATTTLLDPGGDGNVTIVAVTNVSRTGNIVSFDGVYDEANLTHVVNKIGLLNTATDAGTGLQNVIGGGGTSPYDETLTIDLTGASEFDLTMGIDVEAIAT